MKRTRDQAAEIRIQKEKSGAAILLALWAIFLLSALVISWALDIDSRLAISGEGTRMLKAEALACSGAEVALHPMTKPGSENLTGELDEGAKYEARLTGEGGRLDLNWLVAGEDPQKLDVLQRYLENKGVDLNERDKMIDSLLDWVEPNMGLHRLNAPPESDDYHPPHAGGLTRIDELKKVAGWAEFTSAPGWDDDFTVNGSKVGIDLAWASRDVLLSLPGMRAEMVDRFLQLRQGPDGIDGTEDDGIRSLEDSGPALGLNSDQFDVLKGVHQGAASGSPLVCFNQVQIFRVVSVGTAGKVTRTVQMVFQRRGNAPSVITWKEF